jgi:hypothetical protein
MSSFSPLDSQLYGESFRNARVAALFTDAHHVKTMLEVEAALARVQAKLGLIPEDAALEIERAVQSLEVDFAQLRAGIANDGFPVIELVRQLRANLSSSAADFVHFGATTQDVLDTANALRIRDALEIIRELLEELIGELSQLARAYRDTIMPGRTHTQQALPITFGFKVAGWLARKVPSVVDQLECGLKCLREFLTECDRRTQVVFATDDKRFGSSIPHFLCRLMQVRFTQRLARGHVPNSRLTLEHVLITTHGCRLIAPKCCSKPTLHDRT